MEPDALLDLIVRGEAGRVVEALSSLSDSERSRLSRPVAELCRRLERGDDIDVPDDASVWRKQRQRFLGPPTPVMEAACLARYGVCPRSQLRRNRLWFFWNETADLHLLQVLRDRKPPFLSDWIGDVYDAATDTDPAQVRWRVVRELVREGLIETPRHPEYVRAMVDHFVPRWGKRPENLSLRLLDDPGLLDDEIWRLFEVDVGRDAWFRKPEPRRRGGEPEPVEAWGEALLALCRGGHLDRSRLLDASFDALSRAVLGSSTLTGIRRFAEGLNPTLDELAERQESLLRMLGCGEGPVVGLAVRSLGKLRTKGRLDDEEFLRAAPSAFDLAAKTHPLRVLKLVEKVFEKGDHESGDRRRLVLAVIERALLHPSRDVRDHAVTLLERLGEGSAAAEDEEAIARVAETVLPALAPAVAERVSEVPGVEAPVEALVDAVNAPDAGDLQELRQRLGSLPDDVRSVHGLDAHLPETWPELPPPWRPEPGVLPVLKNLEPIEPIADWEELVDAASHAAEVVESGDELERLLAGLARFGGHRPDGFERRTEALVKRLESGGGEFVPRGLRGSWTQLAFDVRDLLAVWLRGQRQTRYSYIRFSPGPFLFLGDRLKEIRQRIEKRRTQPLLAEPTHFGGWIEPGEMVRRVAELNGRPADPADLVQALLRLAPDGRDEALESARGLQGPLAPLLRFALGSDATADRPTRRDRKRRLAWLAAVRSRDPRVSARPYLEGLGMRGLRGLGPGPDGLEPAELAWRATTVQQRSVWSGSGPNGRGWPHLEFSVSGRTKPFHGDPPQTSWIPMHVRALRGVRRWIGRALAETDLPTAGLHRLADTLWEPADLQSSWQVDWLRTLWPANADAVLVAGARWTMRRLDMAPSTAAPNHAYLAPLFDVDRGWTEIAYLAAVVAVMSRDADARAAALDALIEGIEDGRVHPEPLSEVVERLFEPGWAKTNRLAEALDEVSRVGPLHQLAVARVLDAHVANWTERPHGAHLVLQLLLDCLEALGTAPSDAARDALKHVKGQSKTARLAIRLRELQPFDSGSVRAACAEAWRARLDRAEVGGSV